MPAYEGKGQPPASTGWFSGFAAWWSGLTPHYVTSRSTKATTHASTATPTPHAADLPSAPPSPPATPGDAPSGSRAATSATRDPSSGDKK